MPKTCFDVHHLYYLLKAACTPFKKSVNLRQCSKTCKQCRADTSATSPWARAITHNPLLSDCKHMQKDKHGLRLNSSMSPSVCAGFIQRLWELLQRGGNGSWWWNFKGQVLRADASLRIKHNHGSHEARVYAFTSTLTSWTNQHAVNLMRTRVCLWINKVQSVWREKMNQ